MIRIFPLNNLFLRNDVEAVITKANELGTRRLRLLKDEFDKLTYFQFRLILGSQTGGGAEWTSIKS